MTEDIQVWCSSEVEMQWGRSSPTCAREASEILRGKGYCWQHARKVRQDWVYWEREERTMKEMDELAPTYPHARAHIRATYWVRNIGRKRTWNAWTCDYCGRSGKTSRVAVNPITLQRNKVSLCGRKACFNRLEKWQGVSQTRRKRAIWDTQQEQVRSVTPALLLAGIGPQYPSVSRATLQSFLDSKMESATVANPSDMAATGLSGSIKALGFEDEVFVEIRDKLVTLRRIPKAS